MSEKNVDPYWDVLNRGFQDAACRLDLGVEIRAPLMEDAAVQRQQVEDMLNAGVDALAIVGSEPATLAPVVDEAVAAGLPVVSFDLDMPGSRRHAHVGTKDYPLLGKAAADAMAEVLPKAASVLIQVGSRHGAGALGKAAGFREEIERRGFRVAEVTYDAHDEVEAEQQALEALRRHDDIVGLYGVYGYHPGAQLRAAERLGRDRDLSIVGFDLLEPTIRGLREGTIHASIWLQEYYFGYYTTALLASMARLGIEETLELFAVTSRNSDFHRVIVEPVLVRQDHLDELLPRLARLGVVDGLPRDCGSEPP